MKEGIIQMEYLEMKKLLEEHHTTYEEMQMMWDYCLKNGHSLICQLDRCGKSWTDLNKYALATLEKEYNKLKEKSVASS